MRKNFFNSFIVSLIALFISVSTAHAVVEDNCQTINFDNLPAGTFLDDEYLNSNGVTISVHEAPTNTATIFDSANPTGGDTDLQTPGYGPGNNQALYKLLIIAENTDDNDNDGLIDIPDDEGSGGIIRLTFSQPQEIESLKIIDIESSGTKIFGYEGNTLRFTKNVPGLGDNSVQTISFGANAETITRLDIDLKSSGAVDKIKHCPNTYSISGRTLLEGSLTPIDGVTVSGNNGLGNETSNGNGEYEFTSVEPGTYQLTASKEGYVVVQDPNPVVVNGNLENLNFILACAPGYKEYRGKCIPVFSISGKALLQGALSPIPGVEITSSLGTLTTNGSGSYIYENAPNGTYTLTASKPGYTVVSTPNPVIVNNGNVTDANFILTCAEGYALVNGTCQAVYTLSGRTLLQGSLSPISGVSISHPTLGQRTSSATGAYSYTQVPNGSYTLSASKAGYVVVSTPNPVTVAGANVEEANFILACAAGFVINNGQCVPATYSISGFTLLQGTNDPVSGVMLSGGSLGTTMSNTSGAYQYTGVQNGTYTINASKPGYVVVSTPNPVTVNGQNVTGANFILACAPGYVLLGKECREESENITIEASDGTFEEYVLVEWTRAECAVSYRLYRAPTGGSVFDAPLQIAGSIPATGAATLTFEDTSAVPGTIYDYAAIALGQDGEECARSNIDPGYRKQGFNDCDGDGVSDEQEIEDGTDPCDPGSFFEDLTSPAYVKWNTFLSQWNFAELIADGTEPVRVTFTLFDINGVVAGVRELELQPGEQFDIDATAMAPDIDTYGLAKIEWTDLSGEENPEASLNGRMTNYRPDPEDDSFSFAFAKEFRNAVRGRTYATANSYDPQGQGYTVPNWMELINLDDVVRHFTYNLYTQGGELLETYEVTLQPYAERDINAGHENGQGVYLAEVIPHDGDTNYTMTVSRYSSNSFGGNEANTYNFAFARLGQKGTGDSLYAPINNEVGGCFSSTNWVEVANVLDEAAVANITFRNDSGIVMGETSMTIDPKEQFHFNASAMLLAGERGSVEVSSPTRGAFIAQSIRYFHDCESNLTQTAYLSEGRIAAPARTVGNFNRYIDIENRFQLYNVTASPIEATVSLFSNGLLISETSADVDDLSGLSYNFNDQQQFSTQANTYGVVVLETPGSSQAIAEILRERRDPKDAGRMDFVVPTAFK